LDRVKTFGLPSFRLSLCQQAASGALALAVLTCFPHLGPAQPVPGAAVWLDADDPGTLITNMSGQVSAWVNKGSAGGNASQSNVSIQPLLIPGAIHGRPALRFGPTPSHLAGSYTNTGATLTLYLVVQWENNVQDRGPMGLYNDPAACNQNASISTLDLLRDNSGKIDAWRDWFNGGSFIRSQVVQTFQTYIVALVYDGTGGPATMRVRSADGVATDLELSGTNPPFNVNRFVLGGRQTGCTTVEAGWSGHIAELLLYNTSLNATSQAIIEGYLSQKWIGGDGCLYEVAPSKAAVPAGGGNQSVSVLNLTGCGWTAASQVGWIAVTSGSSGNGSGTVQYTVASNPSANTRTGELTIAGKSVIVHQAGTAPGQLPVFGAQVWLDANDPATLTTSGGAVSAWANKGLDGGAATQAHAINRPSLVPNSINGRPAVFFDGAGGGAGDFLTGFYTNTGPTLTLYLVIQWVNNPENRGPFGLYNYPTACNQASSANNLDLFRDDKGQVHAWRNWFGGGNMIRKQVIQTAQTYIVELRYTGTSGHLEVIRPDGGTSNDTEQYGNFNVNFSVNRFVMGGRQDNCTGIQEGWSGRIAELILYDANIESANDRQTMRNYLRAKWQVDQCGAQLSSYTVAVPVGGTSGTVDVTIDSGCEWTATSNNSWITVTSGASGTGNGTVGYSVAANSSSGARSGTITIAGQSFSVNQAGTGVGSGSLTYNFDDGTMQGWTNVSTSGNQSFAVATQFGGTGNDLNLRHAGTHSLFQSSFDNRDVAHTTLWARSPAFKLNGSGDLTLYLLGGTGNTGVLPTHASQIPVNSVSGGFQFVALRNVQTGDFVLRARKPGDNPWPSIWQPVTFTAAQLATVDQEATYTLDLIDAGHGSWGWVAMDSVTIPATLIGTEPPTLNYLLTATNTVVLSWTESGFQLQAQTNAVNIGLSDNWNNYPGGATSPVAVPLNPVNGTVFFRLISQ
jgi:hypothetical protein